MDKFKSAVILAGGKSTRMEFDKQFLKINKRRLMDNIINKLKQEFEEIIIVTNKPEYYLGLSHKVVSDEIKQKGPLSGIHIGLKESSSKYIYFIACDMPIINIDYIKYMKNEINNKDVSACVTKLGDWIEPFNAFYNKDLINDIENHLLEDRRSVFSLLKKLNTFYVEEKDARKFSPNWDMFLNLNTKEDLSNYLHLIGNEFNG
ncbi:molybdenum cofactor guanylyltransferase [Tepidibacter formicigenes]|jgi:molybdopterin-guanine dinucleotide biosynthesis protein A|uniref:Probable molybdenum cofactor guanylyltransferase n=1 Tax=Tepidibacter formicigenes DSM 15518 TaxID=1123349 RepID=A0A1M6QGU5_9FIRM|nr:molybdenum cofactor guanylyltransferase [Tepidibacter formicigenes]SHK19330.1 molybdenum cofactor guanylyltransferase [Tepidibacter formicigenes DSM 15518]